MSDTVEDAGSDNTEAGTPNPATAEKQALAALRELLGTGADLAGDYLELLAVEGRLAGRSLVLMLALAIALALLLVATWLFLGLAMSAWLIDTGVLSTWQALLAVALTHLAMALLAWLSVRRLSNNLVFGGLRAALRRQSDNEGEP